MIKFQKERIDSVTYEAASVCDVDGNGVLDIVCGEYWYVGPDFKKRHKICDVQMEGEYYDDFSDLPLDVTGNGLPDIITGGWWGKTLRWRENPGDTGEWTVHDIDTCGSIETIRFFDIDGCGIPEIFPNTPGEPQAFYKLVRGGGDVRFDKYVIADQPSGHGLGFGDLSGDGRTDIILAGGWLEQPDDPFSGIWKFHPEFDLGSASIPIIAHDITGSGSTDLIVGQSHDFGLFWFEQKEGDNEREWIKHEIDLENSQYHDLKLIDIDRDGELELVTGKRYRAHCGSDPGSDLPVGIYYFKINGGNFSRHIIDRGDPDKASGCGIYFWVEDLDGNGWPDIVAPGKDGLYIFRNLGEGQ